MINNQQLKEMLPMSADLTNPIADSVCVEAAQAQTLYSDELYDSYVTLGGLVCKSSYVKGLFSFFCHTLNAFVSGDLSRPNGKAYSSKNDAVSHFLRWANEEKDIGLAQAEKIAMSVMIHGDYT